MPPDRLGRQAGCDLGPAIPAADNALAEGPLQSGVRRALSGTMHPNDRFKEIPARQLFPLRAQRTNDERMLECGANLRLIVSLDPDQHLREVSGIERPLRRLNYRMVEDAPDDPE
jgi:hypothetical protein